MKIVLLSGGSGQRLWPLSNDIRSKQFLKLLKNENNQVESMVQRVYRQIRKANIDSEIVIATGKNQENSVRNHLGNLVDVVLEPERRDTFPAIALATAYLHFEKGALLDEPIAIMPVDTFADVHFFEKIVELEQILEDNEANLGLLGIHPTYPSAKYGYIMNKNKYVTGFVEKPSEKVAAEIIADGAMWNGGVFVFKPKYVLDIVRQYIPFTSYEEVETQYGNLPKTSFDYEVTEKESKIVMAMYDGYWKDLGTWNTLTEVIESKTVGKVILSDNTINTHVINELDIPLTVIGASNLVVVASPDGVLVSDKIQSATLKEYIDELPGQPMYEETPWGSSKILEYNHNDNDTVSVTKSLTLKKNNSISYEKHFIRDEVLTIISGTGELILDDTVRTVQMGDVIRIPRGVKHGMYGVTEMKIIEVGIGSEVSADDVENYDYSWDMK